MHEDGLHRMIALAVFVGTYLGLGLGRLPLLRVDRTGVAIIGAAAMIATGVISWDRAVVYREIDWQLLVLFSGLFVVIAGVEASGLVGDLLGRAGALNLHRPAVLTVVTAVLSNLVSNVPACCSSSR